MHQQQKKSVLTIAIRFCLCIYLSLAGPLLFGNSVDPAVVTLFQLVDQRLSHMKDVAAYKWRKQIAIEDLKREQVVTENASTYAVEQGLDRHSSRDFFLAQIEAAKVIQRSWFVEWEQDSSLLAGASKDLVTEIRPELIRLGNQIIAQLQLILESGKQLPAQQQRNLFTALLDTDRLDLESRQNLFDALVRIKLDPDKKPTPQLDSLSRTLESGILRIGTTGDYAPFSYYADDTLAGIDIEMGKDLAASLNVDYQFVTTSWPDLMRDLEADKYDIGMSGISWNDKRQESAHFSIAYHQGGKSPISRCADVSKFNSLAKIDRVETRMIVNPGGTNQKFLNANIANANIRVFDDNTRIFTEIINGTADVMITDLIEVQLQSARHPELCASMGNTTLSHLEKAYLLPQDNKWKLYVDKWLFKHKQAGTLPQVFARHLH